MNANDSPALRSIEPHVAAPQTIGRHRRSPRDDTRFRRRLTTRSRGVTPVLSAGLGGHANAVQPRVSHRTVIAMVCTVAVGYAVIRYIFAKGVPLEQFPSYVLNKAAALAALCLFAAAITSRTREHFERARAYGKLGVGLTLLHCGLSMALLNPRYFGKLFGDAGVMTWQGELSLLLGVVALVLILRPMFDRGGGRSLGSNVVIITVVGLHVAVMGAAGWFAVSKWPGGLPPITLISVAVAGFAIAVATAAGVGRRGGHRSS